MVINLETVDLINDKNQWQLENLLISSNLEDSSMTMKFCELIGDYQNKLIKKYYQSYIKNESRNNNLQNSICKRRVNVYAAKKKDILFCEQNLLEEAYKYAGGHHFQSEEKLVIDMERFLITKVLGNLPELRTKITKEYEYNSTENIYLTQSKISNLKFKMKAQKMSYNNLMTLQKKLKRSSQLKEELYNFLLQLIIKCMIIKDEKANDRLTINKLALNLFGKEFTTSRIISKVLEIVGNYSQIFLICIFEEIELSLYKCHKKKLAIFHKEVNEVKVQKIFGDFCKKKIDITIIGLKRLIGRVHYVHDIQNKGIGDLTKDFEDLFRHSEQDLIDSKLIQINLEQKDCDIDLGEKSA